jgi:hypothetical protein
MFLTHMTFCSFNVSAVECCAVSKLCFVLLSCLAYSLTLNMEVICSAETLIESQRNTRRYTPEDGNLQTIKLIKLLIFLLILFDFTKI